jgi:hypothetical protein
LERSREKAQDLQWCREGFSMALALKWANTQIFFKKKKRKKKKKKKKKGPFLFFN